MKSNLPSGLLCLCLLVAGQQAGAQSPQPAPAAEPASPSPAPAASSPQSSSSQTNTQNTPLRKAAPYDDGVNTGDGFSIELRAYDQMDGHPLLRGGQANTSNAPGDFVFPGWPKYGLGAVVSVPVGKGAVLRAYGLQFKSSGSAILGADRNFFAVDFPAGSRVDARYTIQDFKLSYEYNTYPITQRLRLKTLWQLDYAHAIADVWIPSTFDGTQTPIDTNATARHIIYPSFGLAIEHSVSKHLRWTARSTGFAYPHHAVIWDADANAAVRIGQGEVVIGAMAHHFKTTPLNDYYVRETMTAAYVGFRWYLFK